MKKQSVLRLIIWIVAGIYGMQFTFLPQLLAHYIPAFANSTPANLSSTSSTMNSIYTILKNNYFDKDKLVLTGMEEGSIKWFVEALQDPYTEYLPAQQNETFMDDLKGEQEFDGIGAAIQKKDNVIVIQEVYKDTPAARAGLQPLDAVVEISGEKTATMTAQEAVQKIRWPKGTTVKLLIFRSRETDAMKKVFTVEVTRQTVSISSVSSSVIPVNGKNVWYISISIIGEDTETLLKKEITSLKDKNLAGIILDLRGNGGWYLPKSVEIASHFIPKGKTIVTAKYTNNPDEKYVSKWYGDYENLPVVVLMDWLTASAGEIIAAALKQERNALLVGKNTFGKWSIQTLVDISSGAALKYTIGKRYLPDDSNIDHIGVKPDVEVWFDKDLYDKEARDSQKERAIVEMGKLIK
jgi:carboxyl-terminal processing protease